MAAQPWRLCSCPDPTPARCFLPPLAEVEIRAATIVIADDIVQLARARGGTLATLTAARFDYYCWRSAVCLFRVLARCFALKVTMIFAELWDRWLQRRLESCMRSHFIAHELPTIDSTFIIRLSKQTRQYHILTMSWM